MTLYAADVMDLAKPIEKKKRGKAMPTPPASEPSESSEPVTKPKRVMSEKQKEALAKGQEKRRQKKLEQQQEQQRLQEEIVKKEQELKEKEEAMKQKKEAQKEKRRLARLAKKEVSFQTKEEPEVKEKVAKRAASPISQEIEKQVKKVRVKASSQDPPLWFQKYVEGVKREQSMSQEEKKPKKQIQQEAEQVAREKWDNGLVRDRLRNEVDSHMNRMYSMIFGRVR